MPLMDTPAVFRHPQAHRQVQLGDVTVGYAVQRVRRRSVGLVVGNQGLTLRAPPWITLTALDDVVRSKSAWVLRQLANAHTREQHNHLQRVVWKDGVVLPFMGRQLQLVTVPAATGVNTDSLTLAGFESSGDSAVPLRLQMVLPLDATPQQVRNVMQQWFMNAARQHFAQRLDYFSNLLGVHWTSLRLSNAKTRWGSARIDGAIRLNWRLMHACADTIDYVVVHELAHLRFMNHSPSFWRTVASVFPDYRAARQRLRALVTNMWDEPLAEEDLGC